MCPNNLLEYTPNYSFGILYIAILFILNIIVIL